MGFWYKNKETKKLQWFKPVDNFVQKHRFLCGKISTSTVKATVA